MMLFNCVQHSPSGKELMYKLSQLKWNCHLFIKALSTWDGFVQQSLERQDLVDRNTLN